MLLTNSLSMLIVYKGYIYKLSICIVSWMMRVRRVQFHVITARELIFDRF